MTNRKANKIRFKGTAGWEDLQSFYSTIESFAITYTKTKQRFNTVLWDMNLELTEIEDRKS